MTVSDTINSLKSHVSAAYNAVEEKGGTVPTQKNVQNLAEAIASITGGGGGNVPLPDNNYGAVEYFGVVPGEGAKTIVYEFSDEYDFMQLCSQYNEWGGGEGFNFGGTSVPRGFVLRVKVGSLITHINKYFCHYCTTLYDVSFAPNTKLTYIGDNFCDQCENLNCPFDFSKLALRDRLGKTYMAIGVSLFNNCRALNSPIIFPEQISSSASGSDYEVSGGMASWLAGCASFNQPITLPIPLYGGSSARLWAYFLSGNTIFNAAVSLPTSLVAGSGIGDNFLSQKYSFNKPLVLPTNIGSIGFGFLSNARAFNQPLTIPATVTNVGAYFLSEAWNFTGPLTINTTKAPTASPYSLSSNLSDAPIHVTGVTLQGPGAEAWKTALPDQDSSPYRKLIVAS